MSISPKDYSRRAAINKNTAPNERFNGAKSLEIRTTSLIPHIGFSSATWLAKNRDPYHGDSSSQGALSGNPGNRSRSRWLTKAAPRELIQTWSPEKSSPRGDKRTGRSLARFVRMEAIQAPAGRLSTRVTRPCPLGRSLPCFPRQSPGTISRPRACACWRATFAPVASIYANDGLPSLLLPSISRGAREGQRKRAGEGAGRYTERDQEPRALSHWPCRRQSPA